MQMSPSLIYNQGRSVCQTFRFAEFVLFKPIFVYSWLLQSVRFLWSYSLLIFLRSEFLPSIKANFYFADFAKKGFVSLTTCTIHWSLKSQDLMISYMNQTLFFVENSTSWAWDNYPLISADQIGMTNFCILSKSGAISSVLIKVSRIRISTARNI